MIQLNIPTWHTRALTDGQPVTLETYRGRPIILLFFNIGCHGCMTRGLPVAAEIARQYPHIQVIGIHSNFGAFGRGPEQVAAALEKFDINFPVLLDDGHATFDSYQAEGTPHWVFIDSDGQVSKSIFGSQPNALLRIEYTLIEMFGADR